ncbi:DUF5953 family protein [Archangium sp.]|uniref:DUF5953 family protein n=1 Tax=Archangium sp. TaxID=1872627 RepID=UPI002D3DBA2D|nr:DUF5953 family protein [Archangium sp.]HYO59150.1 DUF5953 family protein [Archangium sp.]
MDDEHPAPLAAAWPCAARARGSSCRWRSRRIVRLTDTPLDLDNPAHLNALLRAYERFPEIGGRSAA